MDPIFVRKVELANVNLNRDFATEVVGRPGYSIYLNSEIPEDPYLNFTTFIKTNDPKSLIEEVEAEFRSRRISPSFYISPTTEARGLEEKLVERGYQLHAHDAWMFFDPKKTLPLAQTEAAIKKVETDKEFGQFVKIFIEVYSKGQPDDPYQGLSPLYGKFLWKRFRRDEPESRGEYFLAILNGRPVGIASLLYNSEVAGFYSLAVLPPYRRLGIGRALQVARVKRALELGLRLIYLVTEVGSRNEKIFPKSGFQTEFNGKLYHHD